MNILSLIFSAVLMNPLVIITSTPLLNNDFSIAVQNYEQGRYNIAQIFFENFINDNPDDKSVPQAYYYLIKIYDHNNDLIKFFNSTNRYLISYKYDEKREEIFNLLLKKLVEQGSFYLAFEYLQQYDYLTADTALLNKIVLTLGRQSIYLDKFLKDYPENESLKIIKALSIKTLKEREKILQTIKGVKGRLYLIENYLLSGDTVRAWEEYKSVKLNEIPKNILYRWARLATIFSENDLKRLIIQLDQYPDLMEKKKILTIFIERKLSDSIVAQDEEDIKLVQQFLNMRHIDSSRLFIPDSINIEAIMNDTLNIEENLSSLRIHFKSNYKIDSIYCAHLIKKQAYNEGYSVIKEYLQYLETRNFSRMVRALKYYAENDYKMALNDLVFCLNEDPFIRFIYADCLRHTNRDPAPIYEELIMSCGDSLIKHQSLTGYINAQYSKGNYAAITKINFQEIDADSALVKLYLLSLVHIGKTAKAETLYKRIFENLDLDFYIARIDYLIENKLWKKAGMLLDSLINIPEFQNDETLNYDVGMVAFHNEDYDRAEINFSNFVKRFKNSKYYYPALFKIGTLKYLKQDFDSAAYYYSLAAHDSTLQIEALQNQLVSLKKAEHWQKMINIGKRLVEICPDSMKSDCYFEIGYACLRTGLINEAINNLKTATRLKSLVDYHYWLGEAYLGKGDFQRAIYHYQKIVHNFKKDAMWYPTALFKSGLALEMEDEIDEARKIYQQIIRERGKEDLWGIEAQKRLELLK
ncbi:MAG: tetratricopeptide repeat protein [bacterium]